jgi:hypothetical protein
MGEFKTKSQQTPVKFQAKRRIGLPAEAAQAVPCHSERSEESLILRSGFELRQINSQRCLAPLNMTEEEHTLTLLSRRSLWRRRINASTIL